MKRLLLLLPLILPVAFSLAEAGVTTNFTTTWNGITRSYSVYTPVGLPPSPPLVICLHVTVPDTTGTSPPTGWCAQHGWNLNADRFGFLLVSPVSSWGSPTGQWLWDAFNLDAFFTVPPDDSGFLRNLIQTIVPQYGVDPNRVFVTGASSGGFMANRVGIDSSDLVAAIATQSGPLWANSAIVPNVTASISVLMCYAQRDTQLFPHAEEPKLCGGRPRYPLLQPTTR